MKIIIAGLGRTGILLAAQISKENHDVIVIDDRKDVLDFVTDRYNVSGICGNATSSDVIKRAGAELADVVVALTQSDETNFMVCMIAKNLGTRYTIARMMNPELTTDKKFISDTFKIDYILEPKEETALEIVQRLGLPGAISTDGFFSHDTTLLKVKVEEESELLGKNMREVRAFFETDLIVAIINRKGKALIPKGDLRLEAEDEMEIIVSRTSLKQTIAKLGVSRKAVKRVMIVGGGETALYLARHLLEQKKRVTVLDNDRERCIELSQKLPQIEVSCAQEIDEEVLDQEGIRNTDAFISLTGKDDINLVISMFAWSCNVKTVITKISAPSYEKLLQKTGMVTTVSPAILSTERITGFIRNIAVPNEMGDDILCMHQIAEGAAEAIEFIAYDNFAKKGIPFKSPEFSLEKDTIIGVIIRDNTVIIPDGDSAIQPGDHVIVITKQRNKFNTLNEIFKS